VLRPLIRLPNYLLHSSCHFFSTYTTSIDSGYSGQLCIQHNHVALFRIVPMPQEIPALVFHFHVLSCHCPLAISRASWQSANSTCHRFTTKLSRCASAHLPQFAKTRIPAQLLCAHTYRLQDFLFVHHLVFPRCGILEIKKPPGFGGLIFVAQAPGSPADAIFVGWVEALLPVLAFVTIHRRGCSCRCRKRQHYHNNACPLIWFVVEAKSQ
jgi:hypothetical protein